MAAPSETTPRAVRVSAVVVTWNSAAHIERCIRSLTAADEIVVVDNASTDGSAEVARSLGVKVVEHATNEGFARACNAGAAVASGDLLLFANPDTVAGPGAVEALVERLESEPRCGIAGAFLVAADGTPQPAHDMFLTLDRYLRRALGRALARAQVQVEWVYAAFVLVRRVAFDDVGGFDPDYHMYYEDMDLCWRLRQAGWLVALEPRARVVHAGGASAALRWQGFPGEEKARSLLLFQRKHAAPWERAVFRAVAAASYGAYAAWLLATNGRARALPYAQMAKVLATGRA